VSWVGRPMGSCCEGKGREAKRAMRRRRKVRMTDKERQRIRRMDIGAELGRRFSG